MDIISTVGSIASIVGVPIAIWLYLKQVESKKLALQKSIVRQLSFEVGKGRVPSVFEIKSTIETESRYARISPGNLKVHHIIEDLVTEVLGSPLLDSVSKEKAISGLKDIHPIGKFISSIYQNEDLLPYISHLIDRDETQSESKQILKKILDEKVEISPQIGPSFVTLFGVISIPLALIFVSIQETSGVDVYGFSESLFVGLFSRSMAATIVTVLIGFFGAFASHAMIQKISKKLNKKKQSDA